MMYTSTVYMVYDITITHIRYHCGVLPAKIQHVYIRFIISRNANISLYIFKQHSGGE